MELMQQRQQVTRKRSSEQCGNGCPEKNKKAKEKTEAENKADLEDGASISIQVEVVEVSTHNYIHTETQKDQLCCIQSVVRRDREVAPGGNDGNLLKAGSERSLKGITVEFTGTDPGDPATEFHMEKSDDKEANALRYLSGNESYYLKIKKLGQVDLRKREDFPTDDKYFFRIKSTGPEIDTFHTFQSLKTKEYLHCSNDGKVFMNKVATDANGVPKDRQTWFKFMPSFKIQEHLVQYQKVDVTFAENDSGIECETVQETIVDAEDSGKANYLDSKEGNFEDPRKESSEDREVGNSEDPGKDNCNDPGWGKPDAPGEVTSAEDPKERHTGDPSKGNSDDVEEKNSEDADKKTFE